MTESFEDMHERIRRAAEDEVEEFRETERSNTWEVDVVVSVDPDDEESIRAHFGRHISFLKMSPTQAYALAVNLMLVVGIILLLWQARAYVDISLLRLFGAPTLALAAALLLGYATTRFMPFGSPGLWPGTIKAIVFSATYGLLTLALERDETVRGLRILRNYLHGSAEPFGAARSRNNG